MGVGVVVGVSVGVVVGVSVGVLVGVDVGVLVGVGVGVAKNSCTAPQPIIDIAIRVTNTSPSVLKGKLGQFILTHSFRHAVQFPVSPRRWIAMA